MFNIYKNIYCHRKIYIHLKHQKRVYNLARVQLLQKKKRYIKQIIMYSYIKVNEILHLHIYLFTSDQTL